MTESRKNKNGKPGGEQVIRGESEHKKYDYCEDLVDVDNKYKHRIPEIVQDITDSCREKRYFDHVDTVPIPSRTSIIEIINDLCNYFRYHGFVNLGWCDPF